MLGTPLTFSTVFASQAPKAQLLDVREDTTAQTTYTFTSCNLGSLGSTGTTATASAYQVTPHVRSPSRKVIFVIVHGEDDAITFGVNSVTIGGVSGTELIDRGGGTNAINTAIYRFNTDDLDQITNTDIAVTFSEAITGCAIGVVLIENVGVTVGPSANSSTSANVMSSVPTPAVASTDRNMYLLIGTTCATGGGTESLQFYIGEATSTVSPHVAPMLLYAGSNANFDYGAAWTYAPGYSADVGYGINTTWSGAGVGDVAFVLNY